MSREEKERRIIDLYYNQGKTTREIIKELRVSPNYVSGVLKKKEEERNNSIVTNNQQQPSSSSLATKAYELLSQGKKPFQVAIALNIRQSEATKYCREYWRLRGLHKLNLIYKETNGKIWPFWNLYRQLIKQKGMSIEQVVNVIDTAVNRLPHMESLYKQAGDETQNMQNTRQHLLNDMKALEYKISILDKTAFSCEQECRRKEQQLQELVEKKNRLEKWIANISNNDELKKIVKENVKAALSENKQVILLSFTALIQTLKYDPEIIKLIYNILLTANTGYKDNSNNITKYLEANKDALLDLIEKQYEKLAEALTKNVMNTNTNSSYNPALSLPQSPSRFLNLSNENNIYRTEESEIYDNSKGDIAD